MFVKPCHLVDAARRETLLMGVWKSRNLESETEPEPEPEPEPKK